VSRRVALLTLSSLLVASLSLSSCGSVSASSALKNWTTSANLMSNDAQLSSDARHVLTALKDARTTATQLHTVCAVLDYETLQAYASLPSPDDQTTQLLTSAYTNLGDGANECYEAAHSSAKRATAAAYLHRAGAAFSEAQARLSALGVSP
jgi:type II secretory pathway component PulJ